MNQSRFLFKQIFCGAIIQVALRKLFTQPILDNVAVNLIVSERDTRFPSLIHALERLCRNISRIGANAAQQGRPQRGLEKQTNKI